MHLRFADEAEHILTSSQKSTKVLRTPRILECARSDLSTSNLVESDHTLIERLRADIIEASTVDTMYSPQSDIVRHVHGDFTHAPPCCAI